MDCGRRRVRETPASVAGSANYEKTNLLNRGIVACQGGLCAVLWSLNDGREFQGVRGSNLQICCLWLSAIAIDPAV